MPELLLQQRQFGVHSQWSFLFLLPLTHFPQLSLFFPGPTQLAFYQVTSALILVVIVFRTDTCLELYKNSLCLGFNIGVKEVTDTVLLGVYAGIRAIFTFSAPNCC